MIDRTFTTVHSPGRHIRMDGRDAAIAGTKIERVASDDRHARFTLPPASHLFQAVWPRPVVGASPGSALHLLAAISGKTMGIVDLETAAVTDWAGDGAAAIHPDDVALFRSACRTLLRGAAAAHVSLRAANSDAPDWVPVMVRIGLAASSPHAIGMFEIAPLSGHRRSDPVDV